MKDFGETEKTENSMLNLHNNLLFLSILLFTPSTQCIDQGMEARKFKVEGI